MTIVIIKDGDAVTSTTAIAAGTENEHASVIALVRKYQADLGEFGRVRFEVDPFETAGGMQTREIALLTEPQSTLLLTYMRNTDIVRAFKKKLVREFWEMVQQRNQSGTSLPADYIGALEHLLASKRAEQLATKANAGKFLGLPGYATGGLINGPGTGTSDSIFARLSNGEYVMSADAVRMFGTGVLDQMNAGLIPAFATGGGIGETGPQLEVTGPSRIFNANQTASMLRGGGDSSATAEEVRALRRDMESNATYMAKLTKVVADGIDTLVNSGVQINGTVETKAVA